MSELSTSLGVSSALAPPLAGAVAPATPSSGFADAVADAIQAQNPAVATAETARPVAGVVGAIAANGKGLPPLGIDLPLQAFGQAGESLPQGSDGLESDTLGLTPALNEAATAESLAALGTDPLLSMPFDPAMLTLPTPVALVTPPTQSRQGFISDSERAGSAAPVVAQLEHPLALTPAQTDAEAGDLASWLSENLDELALPPATASDERVPKAIVDITTATPPASKSHSSLSSDASLAPYSLASAKGGPALEPLLSAAGSAQDPEGVNGLTDPLPGAAPSAGPESGQATLALAPPPVYADLTKPTPMTLLLGGEVGTEPWLRELGQQVLWQAGAEIQQARIRLNPEDLGPIDVEVRLVNSSTEVHFIAAHPNTREALEQGLGRLREQLDAAGLSLSAASVGDGQVGRDAAGGHEARASQPLLPWPIGIQEDLETATSIPLRQGLIDEYA